MSSPNLLAVYARTPTGDSELAAPANGLSINQRKFLQWSDGQLSVAEMAERMAAGHSVDTAQVARDMERLEKLGLLKPLGSGINVATAAHAAPAAPGGKKKLPWWLAGAGAVAVVGSLVAFSQQSPQPVAQQRAADGTPVAQLAPEETEQQILGVMPNPARWFSPGPKPAPEEIKPTALPVKPVEPKLAVAPLPKPVALQPVAAAPQATPTAAAVPPVAPAPVPLAVDPTPKAEPAPSVQVASAQPMLAKPEPPAPNRKPIYREQPEFPVEAARNGVDGGSVRARMTINESGKVVKVDILDAKPRRVFDRAVVAALSKWKFQQAAAGFTVDTDVVFKQD
ncbi:TonB family protein [Chitinimonas viridis]|uniref:Protein TonB n=1 Tax=Chitinimonas viridis TaxID=664880 RepID=A0ABT8B312_9NEIS|nr:TonB family protein [Chitinimonas viridis]MDN3576624.1 TonB family protein [Chitinimonas viridis]